jgi:hypothetical protein
VRVRVDRLEGLGPRSGPAGKVHRREASPTAGHPGFGRLHRGHQLGTQRITGCSSRAALLFGLAAAAASVACSLARSRRLYTQSLKSLVHTRNTASVHWLGGEVVRRTLRAGRC